MEVVSALIAWIGENEAILSGGAALVVMIGFVASPLGAGLRSLVGRNETSASDTSGSPLEDIPAPLDPIVDRPSVAVLPFVPNSDDKDSGIFADGMTDDIITALSHVPGFFVTSSSSMFAYKGQSVDTRQVARELGVRYVVEGRVQRAGDQVRINAKLVEAHTGDQIWTEQFSGDLSDIFSLQDDVTQSIVSQLQPELMQAESRREKRMPTENLDAWTLLHSAQMRFQTGYSPEALKEAAQLAEAAVAKDPNYADAHGFLTWVYSDLVSTLWSEDLKGDAQKAADHCAKGLELDPENPNVLAGAGVLTLHRGDPAKSLGMVERRCAINPNDAFAQGIRGLMLGLVGRTQECLDAIDLSLRLSPKDPRNYFVMGMKGVAYLHLEQYDQAEQVMGRSLEVNNRFFWGLTAYALALAMQGKDEQALETIQEIKRLSPSFELEDLERALKTWHGNPTGEIGDRLERQFSRLREIWPT